MVRARAPRARRTQLDLRRVLETGGVFLPDASARAPSDLQLREGWTLYGAELVAEAAPGCRPWGWWRFSPDSPHRFGLHVDRVIATRRRGFGIDSQLETLAKAGVIDAAEAKAAVEQWDRFCDAHGAKRYPFPHARRLAATGGDE